MPVHVEHHRSIHAHIVLLIISNFSQHGFLSYEISASIDRAVLLRLIFMMYVDNNGIRHNCEELVQEFEKFVKIDGRA